MNLLHLLLQITGTVVEMREVGRGMEASLLSNGQINHSFTYEHYLRLVRSVTYKPESAETSTTRRH
jgi:hypothetical protein